MNERIRQLAEQAKFAIDVSNDPNSPPSWWGAGHNDRFEKFAELIIKECIHACVADIADPRDTIELKCAKKIKEHFGVGQ